MTRSNQRTCAAGHTYFKSSTCPTCPTCEAARTPDEGFLATLGAPARRALEREGITSLTALAQYSARALLTLHGLGPSTMPKLRQALEGAGLNLRDE